MPAMTHLCLPRAPAIRDETHLGVSSLLLQHLPSIHASVYPERMPMTHAQLPQSLKNDGKWNAVDSLHSPVPCPWQHPRYQFRQIWLQSGGGHSRESSNSGKKSDENAGVLPVPVHSKITIQCRTLVPSLFDSSRVVCGCPQSDKSHTRQRQRTFASCDQSH